MQACDSGGGALVIQTADRHSSSSLHFVLQVPPMKHGQHVLARIFLWYVQCLESVCRLTHSFRQRVRPPFRHPMPILPAKAELIVKTHSDRPSSIVLESYAGCWGDRLSLR